MPNLPKEDQQAQVWRAIAKSGLDPRSRHLSDSALPGYDWQIVHLPTGNAFYCAKAQNTYHTLKYRVDNRGKLHPYTVKGRTWKFGFDPVISQIGIWGGETRKLLTEGQRGNFDPDAANAAYMSVDNSRFTLAEQYEISSQLRAIKESLQQNFELSSEQMKRLEEQLDEAEEASHRLGRKDWILLFSGAVFSVILTDFITPDVAHHVFSMLLQGVGHLFNSGGSELPN